MRWCVGAALILLAAAPCGAETRWERSARRKLEITKGVSWPNHEPLIFYLRRGRRAENWPEIYERQHTPENIRAMAEAGVRYGRLHFYKGFGLDMEGPEIEKTRQMAERMHRHGMKVSLYVAGTMFVEAFRREVPESVNWEQRDANGRPVPYTTTQTYRHYPCPNEPEYREYLKKVLRIGVETIKADQIFFDNVQLQPEPKSCRCPRCMSAFKEFLRQRYPTKEAAFRRFGYPDVDYLMLTEWDVYNRPQDLETVDDPVLQEWVEFRCRSLARHNGDFYDYIKSLNPNVTVGFNLKGLYGSNRMWLNGVYHPFFDKRCDFMPFDVGGMNSRIDERTGALISEIRSYKMARRRNIVCEERLHDDLHCAVHMAFDGQRRFPGYGLLGGPSQLGGSRVITPLTEFFRHYNDRYFVDVDNVADVAVLRSWPSMAYSLGGTLVPTILMEQVLIQHKVPFDILTDDHLGTIERYGAIILPGQESLSADAVNRLLAYVRGGGTLVFTGDTADYNQWRERRASNPLRSLMPAEARAKIAVHREGKGRLVYIPEIVPARTRGASDEFANNPEIEAPGSPGNRRLLPSEWVLPQNHEEIYRAVSDHLPRGLSIRTEAPLTTVMELLNRSASRQTMVHFVNFERNRKTPDFAVSLKKQFAGKVKSVAYFSPDADDPKPLPFEEAAGAVNFTVPALRLYGMIVVSYATPTT